MTWRNIQLIFSREVADQMRDRRTLFMVVVLPLLLYPALGIGMMQMTLLFSEQSRTVVILGANDLPAPPLLNQDGTRIIDQWFVNEGDSLTLNVVSDLAVDQTPIPNPEGTSKEVPAESSAEQDNFDERETTLQVARDIRLRLEELKRLKEEIAQADESEKPDVIAMKQGQIEALTEQVSTLFARSDIQVLILIPEGFDEYIRAENERLASRESEDERTRMRPIFIRNSANEKSLIAYGRVREALDNWEQAILSERLQMANLPTDLTRPVNEELVDLAKGEELAANVWSKLFPAMLVVMAMTGAFYPAVDLGAGEKERGTMETLLICPALRSEIVIGKFLTVLLFSLVTALLNLISMGMTGLHVLNTASSGQLSALGDSAIPGFEVLIWVGILAIPLAALFASLSLAFALFAKSTKEGQYYLTPLLTVTMGLTVFCLSPAVELTPFYSLIPVMGPALLLKGMLLDPNGQMQLMWYVVPVLLSSFMYSGLALMWAIDQFQREEVLFREAERFDMRLWLKHLLRDKERLPSFSESIFCFVLIMLLQFAMLKTFGNALQNAPAGQESWTMMRLLVIQQLAIIACPALFMGILLTSSPLSTFQLRIPHWKYLALGLFLPIIMHPLVVELAVRLAWFFPSLPEHAKAALATMADGSVPWYWVVLTFAVTPAICEELAFRGFILAGFRKTGRHYLAIIFSGLLFGIMHMIPQQVFNAALLGMLLGLLVVKSGSIFPAMLFHFGNNALGVLHGNLESMRQTSALTKTLTVSDEFGVHYALWLIAIAVGLAIPMIVYLSRQKTARM
ncbi:MAG TPA: CPBP family intramembrane metalloprotease domain-containing protein [Planctomycetaceae bacterium]|nr:CPBP family intramembrane metalloprotease domain-containing protein [Planctomycetaceae bacterium]